MRELGTVVIKYDPNTGKMGYECKGLKPLEVCGLLSYVTHDLNKLGITPENNFYHSKTDWTYAL